MILGQKHPSYNQVVRALKQQFGSNKHISAQRALFTEIALKDTETIEEFANQYLIMAQQLIGAGANLKGVCNSAMAQAI